MGNPFEMPKGPSNPYAPSEEYRFDPSAFSTGEQGQQLGQMLMSRAQGDAPSVAEEQLKMGLGRQVSAANSMAAGATGMSPGLAMRLAGQQRGKAMMGTNQQMGMLRAGEQAQAQSQLGQWLNQQMQAQMALEQAKGQQRMGYNQAITGVTDPGSAGGWGWPALSALGTTIGFAAGGPAGGAAAAKGMGALTPGGAGNRGDYGW